MGISLRVFTIIVGYPEPYAVCYEIAYFVSIPSLPNLISEFLINQQCFDVDFGEQAEVMEMLGGMPLSW